MRVINIECNECGKTLERADSDETPKDYIIIGCEVVKGYDLCMGNLSFNRRNIELFKQSHFCNMTCLGKFIKKRKNRL